MADRSVVYRLRADISQFRAQMTAAASSVADAGAKMTAANKDAAKFRAGLDTVGGVAGKIGLVAAAGLGAAVVKAANFDQAMSNVRAATGETAANMDRLRDAALQAGADTAFSATEAADGIEQLSKAGVSTADILSGGLRGALDLAAAGNQTVGEAAETAATAMTQFGLSGDKVTHIADLLAAGAGKAQGEVSDLAAALAQGGLVASQMGLSIEDTTGTLAAFASAGLVGSDAGTSFKSMIQRLQNPLGEGKKALERLGIEVYNAEGNFVGITDVAGQLQDKLGGLSQAQRDAALAQIFGSDAVRAATVLYQQGSTGIQGWIDKTNDTGFAAETAATKLDNLKGDLEALGGALETALIGTGSGSDGALRNLTQGLTNVVNAYNDLPGAAKSAVGGVLGVTAALGGGIFVFSKVVQGVANTREAMTNLGVSMDSVKGKAAATGSALQNIVSKGAGVATVIAAVAAATDGLGRIDSSNIGRGLEALTRGGEATKDIQQIVDDFKILGSTVNRVSEPIFEAARGFGLLGDTGLDKAAGNIKQVDQALAGLVESGDSSTAAAQFEALVSALEAEGVSLSDITKQFPQYKTAVENAGGSTNALTGFFDSLGAGVDSTVASLSSAELAFGLTNEQMKTLNESASETAQGFLTLGQGLNDSSVSLGDWIKQMAAQAQALRDFTVNAETAANRGLRDGLVDQLRQAGPEGALRLKQLADASDAEIARANRAFGSGERATQAYKDSLLGISAAVRALPAAAVTDIRTNGLPKTRADLVDLTAKYDLARRDVRTLIKEMGAKPTKAAINSVLREAEALNRKRPKPVVSIGGVGAALAAAAGISAALDRAARARTATIRIETLRDSTRGSQTQVGGADGGRVVAMAGGGTVPGQRLPYGDSVFVFAAPGEEIITNRNGEADQFRADRAAGRIPAYANGGTVLSGTWPQALADGGTVRRRPRRGKRPVSPKTKKANAKLAAELERFRNALDKATSSLDAEKSARDSLVSSVQDQFRSDVFERGNVFAATAGDPRGALRSDIANASAFQGLLTQLVGAGLGGGALAEIAKTGDLQAASSLLGLGRAGVRDYQALFNERERVTSAVGAYAGDRVFGANISQMVAEQKRLNDTVKRLEAAQKARDKKGKDRAKATGKAVADGVNKGATKGRHKKRAGGRP